MGACRSAFTILTGKRPLKRPLGNMDLKEIYVNLKNVLVRCRVRIIEKSL